MVAKTETIVTDLPEHYVANQNADVVNYRKFLKTHDGNVYGDLLNMRKDLETKKGNSRLPKTVKFNVIDTPGLNATGSDNEKHVQTILHGLNGAKAIHLLIITISSGPFTQGLEDAIKYYVNMFSDFNGIIAFVHTRFNYKNSHPTFAQETDIQTRWRHPREGKVLAEILWDETKIHELEARIKALDEFFIRHNVAQPEVLFEARLDMEYGTIGQDQTIAVHCQETGVPGISIERDLLYQEIQLVKEIGRRRDGESWESWSADFRLTSSRNCVRHVKHGQARKTPIRDRGKAQEVLECQRQKAVKLRDKNIGLHKSGYRGQERHQRPC
ncbi:hypothetical protein BGZ81_002731 [Podila clonocystis]|nr:hypothetical protein BGZ81_002731 [Podila clonocystis]